MCSRCSWCLVPFSPSRPLVSSTIEWSKLTHFVEQLITLLCYDAYIGAEYVPKSYYIIDRFGRKSDVVYLRNKRAIDLVPLLRARRMASSSGSGSSSYSGAFSGGADDFHFDIPDFSGKQFYLIIRSALLQINSYSPCAKVTSM